MINDINYEQIEMEISKLNDKFKDYSQDLVDCKSFKKEQELRSKMYECEVKKRVLLRKLQELQNSSISA